MLKVCVLGIHENDHFDNLWISFIKLCFISYPDKRNWLIWKELLHDVDNCLRLKPIGIRVNSQCEVDIFRKLVVSMLRNGSMQNIETIPVYIFYHQRHSWPTAAGQNSKLH